ncbi:MFS general substrate transporter [Punctularia strigosozonata HHB-11173 SS5]|uniref:MFS general substrate transporter n=1 Tax=Punctularia strigosozonata (strain HHB-11173) TaxID=741275 RepID=UPI00044173E7|nr:MFS general substrate transporter [Punctularia strigosozonata HHB-11173 SS5]EIN05659.1 MFS general substrate transporter [Punctularia strigosozonata HHB-11173 SS5]
MATNANATTSRTEMSEKQACINADARAANSDDATEVDAERGAAKESEGAVQKGDVTGESGGSEDPYLVHLDASEDPKKRYSSFHKWLAILVIGSASLCTTCASSIHSFAEAGMEKQFGVSHEVAILGISLFVEGLGMGPLLVGPLSEMYGRNIIYQVSYILFFAFTFPVAFTDSAAVFLVFRFITGFCGSAFLSVAGGSVADLFDDAHVATPMAVYTMTPFIGPVLGPLISGFINQNTTWRWTYRTMLIWIFIEILGLYLLIPETYVPVLEVHKARKMRKTTGDQRYYSATERKRAEGASLFHMILVSCYKPFELILFERMALLIDLWCALILGVLYLAFQAFPIIFEQNHGFSPQETGLSFLGIGLGMFMALASQPYWNRWAKRRAVTKYGGAAPPEERLIMGMAGAVITPISLFWLAFTTYKSVHWIVPIIASVPFGIGIYYIFTCSFTFLVATYRPYAASALAGNSFLRSAFAAVFPLFAVQMYDTLGTVGATALLAGLTTLMAPLPFVFYRTGARIRQKSRFVVGATS